MEPKEVIKQVKRGDFCGATKTLKQMLSGIDYDGAEHNSESALRDADIYSAINNIHLMRLSGITPGDLVCLMRQLEVINGGSRRELMLALENRAVVAEAELIQHDKTMQ